MDFIKHLHQIQELATLPTVAFKILKLLEDPNVNVNDIARLIETDVAISVKIIRVANSPIYGLRNEVYSVMQAVSTLGVSRISNIVVGVALFSKFFRTTGKQSEYMINFWNHSTSVGVVAKNLAQKLKLNFNEREFVAALMHDIGKLAIIEYFPQHYQQIIEIINQEQVPDIVAEERILGANHNQAGGIIADMWQLPADLREVIMTHTDVLQAKVDPSLVAVVRIADLLCEMWGASVNEGVLELNIEKEKAWQILCSMKPELQGLDVEAFTFELEEEFNKAKTFIDAARS